MVDSSSGPSDATLFERVRAGDAAAFELLARRYYPTVYAVALAILGSRMDAEDACQDGMMQALTHWETCREPAKVGPWLSQIVRNRARSLARYRKVRTTDSLDSIDPPDRRDATTAIDGFALGRKLESALSQLSDLQRQVVVLFDVDDWEHRRIATHLAISEGMSRQYLSQARRALRASLGLETLREYRHG